MAGHCPTIRVSDQKNINPATRAHAHDTIMSMNFPKEEERILSRWKEIDAFLRQVELVRGSRTRLASSSL